MAGGEGQQQEETEYESDPEETKMSLKMRRREASDDEDEDEDAGEDEEKKVRDGEKGVVDSDGESDGQGGAADYDEEEEEDEEEEYYDEEYEEEEELVEGEYEEERGGSGGGVEVFSVKAVEGDGEVEGEAGEEKSESQGQGGGEEEKKENEPFAVPTSGAFYMHDDRFRDNAAGRHRRTFGGRKLWESKDDRKWGHDKFEELNLQDRHYEEGRRSSKGYYRGRGKGRGTDRGYAQGNRLRGYGGNIQNVVPKDIRGRGPRRYQLAMKNKSETLPSQSKQSAKSLEKTSHAGSGRGSGSMTNSNVEHESGSAKKVSSSLNSASPPFYPSGSSNKDITLTQKKEQSGNNNNRNFRPAVVDQNFSMPLSNSMMRGKNVVDSIGMDKVHIDDSVPPASGKPVNNVHLPSASSSLGATQIPQSRAQGRGVALSGSTMFQPPQANNQVNKVLPPAAQVPHRNPVQNRGQPSVQASAQQVGQRSLGSSQGSSPPKAGLSINTFQPGDADSPMESGKSNTAVAGKGKGTVQGAGRGSVMYAGGQVMGPGGNVGAGHGDQNLPAFFPVMQFGAQHPGGIGVPAVGMAFPGYVAQPNGLGNSEMTWLPVLASAAGALGATYCPPYLAVDGTYPPRPTGQTSALPAPSKDNNQSKANSETKPQARSEVSNDEFSQTQNKPRRYSEMNFSQ